MDTIREEELIIGNDMNTTVSHWKIYFWKFEKLKYRY